MAEQKYRIIFQGEIKSGYTAAQVRKNLSRLYKVPEEKFNSWFSGSRIKVKENIEQVTALKYQQGFDKAGAVCLVENMERSSSQDSPQPARVQQPKKNDNPESSQPNNNAVKVNDSNSTKSSLQMQQQADVVQPERVQNTSTPKSPPKQKMVSGRNASQGSPRKDNSARKNHRKFPVWLRFVLAGLVIFLFLVVRFTSQVLFTSQEPQLTLNGVHSQSVPTCELGQKWSQTFT